MPGDAVRCHEKELGATKLFRLPRKVVFRCQEMGNIFWHPGYYLGAMAPNCKNIGIMGPTWYLHGTYWHLMAHIGTLLGATRERFLEI